MKKTIRRGVFETNSSSTHAMSIYTESDVDKIPGHLNVEGRNFDWDYEELKTPEEKISYLYTCLIERDCESCYQNKNEVRKRISAIQNMLYEKLYELGCEARFNLVDTECRLFEDYDIVIDHFSEIDHSFINYALNHLDKYLDHRSIIITGNDNSTYDVDEILEKRMGNVKYRMYTKGN